MPDGPITDRRRFLIPFRRALAIALQVTAIVLANRAAFLLRFDGNVPNWANVAFWQMLPWLVAVRALIFVPFRLYEGCWRYTSAYDLRALVGGVGASSMAFYLVAQSPIGPAVYPRSIFFTDAIVLTGALAGIRLTRRFSAEFSSLRPWRRVLVFGAGDAGQLIVRDMKNSGRRGYVP